MIKLEKTEVFGFDAAIRGMRNPMNSWDKSDSSWEFVEDSTIINPNDEVKFVIGDNDRDLALRLAKGGAVHAKYRRMITVYVDITAPLYWWKEFDTYKVGTVANSCSTMHKIQAKEFTIDDFSHEHLFQSSPMDLIKLICKMLNDYRELYNETKNKDYWWQMIQLLPSSYNQLRTVMLNYEVLHNIYFSRRDHKLDEWHDFCDWIEKLPNSWIIITNEQ